MKNLSELSARLHVLRQGSRHRTRRLLDGAQGVRVVLDGRPLLSFASNDYLGLAAHPALQEAVRESLLYGVGSGASHLLTGHHALHHGLETQLAAFVGLPAALLFSTGYMANLAVLTSLLGRHDTVFSDRLNHASLVDAALLSRARHRRYRHADMAHLASLLADATSDTKLIATDAVFSMDGDVAPIEDLLDLAERYDAWLYVDDAHGFGVLGNTGRGVLEGLALASDRLIYMATLGKAAGVAGAFVAGHPVLMDWLVNAGRSYIYTTAMPPLMAAAVARSLDVMAQEAWRRDRLRAHVDRLKAGLATLPWPLMPSSTPIQPLLVGDNQKAMAVSSDLLQRGILLPAIRPPTVPEGTARLRISLSAAHDSEDIETLIQALHEVSA